MGWLPVLISSVAALLLFKTGHTILMVMAVVCIVGCFWSWGVMHNYATEFAKRRPTYSGEFYDLTNSEARAVPNWITVLNIIFTLLGLVLLIMGILFLSIEL